MKHNNDILKRILSKYHNEGIYEYLTNTLSNSELNSLLLEVFNEKVKHIKPNELLKNYQTSRFVAPVELEFFPFYDYELALLKAMKEQGFEIKEFSPVTPLGTSSVVGKVDQKNVLTSLRNTEVVSDITNVMALYLADRLKKRKSLQVKISSAHRHIRCQLFDFPGFTPHFKILSLVTGGFDMGNCGFEINAIIDHINTYQKALEKQLVIAPANLKVELKLLTINDRSSLSSICEEIKKKLLISHVELMEENQQENQYYEKLRFKILWKKGKENLEIIDGGLVNWLQQLTQNKKSRMLISGLGSEYLYRILSEK